MYKDNFHLKAEDIFYDEFNSNHLSIKQGRKFAP